MDPYLRTSRVQSRLRRYPLRVPGPSRTLSWVVIGTDRHYEPARKEQTRGSRLRQVPRTAFRCPRPTLLRRAVGPVSLRRVFRKSDRWQADRLGNRSRVERIVVTALSSFPERKLRFGKAPKSQPTNSPGQPEGRPGETRCRAKAWRWVQVPGGTRSHSS